MNIIGHSELIHVTLQYFDSLNHVNNIFNNINNNIFEPRKKN